MPNGSLLTLLIHGCVGLIGRWSHNLQTMEDYA